MIRRISTADIPSICKIYNYYINNSIATFEEVEVGVEEMQKRVEQVSTNYPWIVYEEEGAVIGYAYANQWKTRSAYRYSAEATVYLDHLYAGKGVGSKLYGHLISELNKSKIHSLIGGISLPNEASIALHEKFGFRKCAHFSEVGRKFDRWIDVGYWEKIFK
ncbi:GNAT family N-acetyltransferase [soil metagenome]